MLLNVQMLRAIAAFLVVFVHLAKLAGMAGLLHRSSSVQPQVLLDTEMVGNLDE